MKKTKNYLTPGALLLAAIAGIKISINFAVKTGILEVYLIASLLVIAAGAALIMLLQAILFNEIF